MKKLPKKNVSHKLLLGGLILAAALLIIVFTLTQGGKEYAKIDEECAQNTSLESMKQKCIEDKIRIGIDNASYCKEDNDCEYIMLPCPLGCGTLVNRREVNRIEDLLSGFTSNCIYQCGPPPTLVKCENNRCNVKALGYRFTGHACWRCC